MSSSVPLLAVKREPPPLRPGAVHRRRLVRALRDNGTSRLTVVIAPAGWGKTTLLSQWVHDRAEERPVAWVSLDESDNDAVRFWTYVLTALEPTGVGTQALAQLSAPGVDALTIALSTLLNELAERSDTRVLVLDDFHAVTDPQVAETVEFLLTYLTPALHVVIAGRSDPPLALARLRARGELTELRSRDLCFTEPEAAALVEAVSGRRPGPRDTSELVLRTEGWAAALQLEALAARDSDQPVSRASLPAQDRHVVDFLDSEVLAGLPARHRDLLVQASVLERLSGPLCDAALEQHGSAAVLDDLDRADLFVVALDARREWFRCHRLFRDALRHRLATTDPLLGPAVLRRAARWFLGEGLVDEAIRHLIAAGDDAAALEALAAARLWFVERGAAAAQLRLGESLVTRSTDPRDHLTMAFAAATCGRFDRILPWLRSAEPLIGPGSPPLEGWNSLEAGLLATRAGYARDRDRALEEARRAVDLEPTPGTRGFVVTRVVLGTVLAAAGRFDDAARVLATAWRDPARPDVPELLELQAAGQFAASLFEVGDDAELRRLLAQVRPQSSAAERAWADGAAAAVARLRTVEGRLAYRDGRLDEARERLRHAAHLAETWGEPSLLVSAHVALADAELATGDRSAARAALERAGDVAASEPVTSVARDRLAAAVERQGRRSATAARAAGDLVETLTDRELSILRMLPGSATQREIGAALFLSINTVKSYTRTLYRKLGVAGRAEAVQRARLLGVI
ncbi:LuxR C-terminal-related transcriptional regulator [Geodermatophilus amargosae]|uniref:LuxR C-terminal-related transcriptional regulator n=1 Tax=Geodermatophilus amargosae TaxID=1296565 RepID=UPI0034DFC7FA